MLDFIFGRLIFIWLEWNVLINVIFWDVYKLEYFFLLWMFLKFLSNLNRIKFLIYYYFLELLFCVLIFSLVNSYLGVDVFRVVLYFMKISKLFYF